MPTAPDGATPGTLNLIGQWPIADATKYAPPGVGDNRLFVPTQGGQLMVFGLNSPSIVSGHGLNFPHTTVGQKTTRTLTFVARSALKITSNAGGCGVCTRTGQFKVLSISPTYKKGVLALHGGQSFKVTVAFSPSGVSGLRNDVVRMVTSQGEADFTVSGTGRAATAWVAASTLGLTLPNYEIGSATPAKSSLTFTNFGAQPATFTQVKAPVAPFSLSGLPKVGATLAPGASITVKVSFSHSTPGAYSGILTVTTNSPSKVAKSVVDLMGVASTPPQLSLSPPGSEADFGSATNPIPVGSSFLEDLTLTNTGGTVMPTATVSTTGPFVALTTPVTTQETTPGSSVPLNVLYLPTGSGPQTGTLVISPAGETPTTIDLVGFSSGTGFAIPAPGSAGWLLGGSAALSGSAINLTPPADYLAGSSFWSTPQTSASFTVNFVDTATGGTGGDGDAFVIADASSLGSNQTSAPVGGNGDLVGFGGLNGVAVAIGEYLDPGTSSPNWLGIANGIDNADGGLNFIGGPVGLAVSTQDTPNDVTVTLLNSTLYVLVDGDLVLRQAVTLPASYVLGFTGGTGAFSNQHRISNVSIEVGGAAP